LSQGGREPGPHFGLLATDPLMASATTASWRDGVYNALGPAEKASMRKAGARNTTMSGDTRVDWSEAFELVPARVGYIWHAGVHAGEVAQASSGSASRSWPGHLGQGSLRDGPELVSLEPRALLGGEKEGRQGPLPGYSGPGHDLAGPQPQDDHGCSA